MGVYTTTLDADGGFVIPANLLDQMKIEVDDLVQLECDEFGIKLTKIHAEDIDESIVTAQKNQEIEGE